MKTITDKFEEYAGTREYDGIVAVIQRWFYGALVRASWCATSVSYFAEILGILGQLGGKNENVYEMMEDCRRACRETGKGAFFYAGEIPAGAALKRGAIVFMLNSGTVMYSGSNKHVTTSQATIPYTGRGAFLAIGGNQSDAIMPKQYPQAKIYAVFYPVYGKDPRAFVQTLYQGALGREGEPAGVKYWTDGLHCEALDGIQAAKGFYMGEEYRQRDRTDAEYVRDLYAGLLGREPDPDGYNWWHSRLLDGKLGREDVLKGFTVSAEFLNRCNSYNIARGSWAQ